MNAEQMPNRLIHESSPYLLQHAYNPVDWYPWGIEPLQIAKDLDKPLIISIGYSACHWCHVMEKESFEDPAIAEIMNTHFVCIKVDREEFPAVDDIYMEAVQAIAGQGGWPLNCFLTPDAKPFYGGTYFPPDNRYGKPSWKNVLLHIHSVFTENRTQVEEQAQKLTQHLNTDPGFLKLESTPQQNVTEKAFIQLAQLFDANNGGFEHAPKFPASFALRFLLTLVPSQKQNHQAENMITKSLNAMAAGGFYDQLAGGFHRYTVDEAWQVPHFEKMLYDNAFLLITFSEAYARFQVPAWKDVVYKTFQWLHLEMQNPETGAFYAALDADSEGVEGKFYTWSWAEIQEILKDQAQNFCDFYHISEAGNWEHTNIPHRNPDALAIPDAHIAAAAQKLLDLRANRIRPSTDTKYLTSWNAMILLAHIRAWTTFGEDSWRVQGMKLANYLLNSAFSGEQLLHTDKGIPGVLEDYAFTIRALVEGVSHWQQFEWLPKAEALLLKAEILFQDPDDGFFFTASEQDLGLIVRKKDFYDNAIPSGNAVMAENYYWCWRLTGKAAYYDKAQHMIGKIAPVATAYPRAFGHWLMVWQLLNGPAPELVKSAQSEISTVEHNILRNFWFPGFIYAHAGQAVPLNFVKGKESNSSELKWYPCKAGTCYKPEDLLSDAIQSIIAMY